MTLSITSQPQLLPGPGRKPKPSTEDQGPEKKPKKVNSEARKQQNRIASRNYREKRKRMLQHLQQLVKDGNSPDFPPSEASSRSYDNHTRASSEEYGIPRPSLSPFMLPSNADFEPLAPSNMNEFDTTVVATTCSSDSNLISTTQHYPTVEQPWNAPIYEPHPSVNTSWWPSNMDLPPRAPSSSQMFHYAPSSNPTFYNPIPTPSQQPRQFFRDPAPESYTPNLPYGIYNDPPRQAPNFPTVSLPPFPPYYPKQAPDPH